MSAWNDAEMLLKILKKYADHALKFTDANTEVKKKLPRLQLTTANVALGLLGA